MELLVLIQFRALALIKVEVIAVKKGLINRYGLGTVIFNGARELIIPSEGRYITVVPSGNFVYNGPPFPRRLRKRLRGDYSGGEDIG